MRVGCLHAILDRACGIYPQRPAVRDRQRALSYRQLALRSRVVAGWLDSVGIGHGDRIVLHLSGSCDAAVALFGVLRTGAAVIPVDARAGRALLRHVLDDARPTLLISDRAGIYPPDIAHRVPVVGVEALRPQACKLPPSREAAAVGPDDLAALIYTSGSTGRPKAVCCSHGNMSYAARAIQARLRLRRDDILLNLLPLSFDYGLYQLFLAELAGACVVFEEEATMRGDPVGTLQHWAATVLPGMPAITAELARRLRVEPPPQSLRMITNTAEHLAPALIEELGVLLPGCRVYPMFGLTECKRVSILTPEQYRLHPGSVGRALPGTRCSVVDAAGRPLPPGQRGELVVEGPHVMQGYWHSPEDERLRFRIWRHTGRRALFTGDTVSMDRAGFLYFHGRADDLYKQDGWRVSAAEVEFAALQISGVREAAVILPGDGRCACLCYSGECGPAAVRAALADRLERYKIPPRVLRLAGIPRQANGKLDKRALRVA